MTSKTTTIHIIDQPGGGVMVYTTAGTPLPGPRRSPAEALATALLKGCTPRATEVRYWHGKDKAMELVRDLVDPDQYGYAVSPEVHRAASRLLGPHIPHQPGEVPA